MRRLGVQGKIWIALKGKLLELVIRRCYLFGWVIVLDYLLYCEKVPSPIAGGPGDGDGIVTVMDNGTCNKREWAVEGRDGDDVEVDADTVSLGIREGGEEIIDGN